MREILVSSCRNLVFPTRFSEPGERELWWMLKPRRRADNKSRGNESALKVNESVPSNDKLSF